MEDTVDIPPLNAVERLLASNRQAADASKKKDRGSDRNRDLVAERQARDIDNYRLAVQRMARDVAVLQDQIILLGDENSAMRTQLQQQQNAAALAADVAQLQSATKEDLLFRYGTLRQELLSKTAELTRYKEKLSRLSQQLTARGAGGVGLELASIGLGRIDDAGAGLPDQLQAAITALQRKYSNMRRAYEQQVDINRSLHQRAEKATRLERACRLQEKVIEKLELLLPPDAQQQQQQTQPQAQQQQTQPQAQQQQPQSPMPRPLQPATPTSQRKTPPSTPPRKGRVEQPTASDTGEASHDAGARPQSSRGSAAKMLEGIRELKEQVAALTSAVRHTTVAVAAAAQPRAESEVVPSEDNQGPEAAGVTAARDDLRLLVELEAAESRIQSLEKQVQDSARLWGKEKAELLLRLQEAEHGLSRQEEDHGDGTGAEARNERAADQRANDRGADKRDQGHGPDGAGADAGERSGDGGRADPGESPRGPDGVQS